MAVDIFGSLFYKTLAILFLIISSTFSTIWDLYMDWGFFEPDSKHLFLRKELKFSFLPSYYFAMVSDPILRFSWIINYLSITSFMGIAVSTPLLRFILATLEILRRYQWCFYRLENEHVNNCGQFRATVEVPLPFALNSN
ncbi:Xenotropic and polytropic retrovirus receptor 1-like protein [Smittium mucronatum]|uniref:Xenotropic and polytropic retrovirus receptor 1-like protein n=1 Tax=Smittium mucronatum TaxID=133383 RepID=A0A1R0H0Q3_9FUNG|nr:Xenotropic and polytropic retrovirus receptor 1-like protein [Smittium mucronatum]